jgi:hypothetical protein
MLELVPQLKTTAVEVVELAVSVLTASVTLVVLGELEHFHL